MYDLHTEFPNTPGALAQFGEAMGKAGIAIEGGGVFANGERAIAHFLFRDGEAAKRAAESAGITVVALCETLVRRLKQGTPGQLGAFSAALASAGVNIVTQYSDHHNRLILVCDDMLKAAAATEAWIDEPDAAHNGVSMTGKTHRYSVQVRWTGNLGAGTASFRSYDRSHDISADGKPTIAGSSDPAFRGDAARWNPEELMVASLAACHKL